MEWCPGHSRLCRPRQEQRHPGNKRQNSFPTMEGYDETGKESDISKICQT